MLLKQLFMPGFLEFSSFTLVTGIYFEGVTLHWSKVLMLNGNVNTKVKINYFKSLKLINTVVLVY